MSLELFTGGPDDTLASRMRACIQAEALEGLVKSAKRHVRVALEDAVSEQSEVTGTSFTAKLDGWSAQFTDPQPKPSVTDHEAFAAWWVGQGLEHRTVERLDIADHAFRWVMAMREQFEADAPDSGTYEVDADEFHNLIFAAITPTVEHVLPDKPLDVLLDAGHCEVVETHLTDAVRHLQGRPASTPYSLVHVATGESVPGVECFRSARQLRLVPKDKRVRLEAKREVGVRLGVRPELLEGGGS